MRKIKLSFGNILKSIKKRKMPDFFKDIFIISMVLSGALLGAAFFYYTKSRLGYGAVAEASVVGVGYDNSFSGSSFYDTSAFILFFCLINIIIARIVYAYDILAAYILVVSIPIMNIIYFTSTLILFSFA